MLDFLKNISRGKGTSSTRLHFIMMQGNDFTEMNDYTYTEKICSGCGRNANVITTNYVSLQNFIRMGNRGTYYPAKLGVMDPDFSSKAIGSNAAYCERCNKFYHLHCVENIRLGGGTMFRCLDCRTDLAPFPAN